MDEIKDKLLEMQHEILSNIQDEIKRSRSTSGDNVGDELDVATMDKNREFYQLLCERDQLKLLQIKDALEAIENDKYGICEECGEKINKKRLKALPFAKLCYSCKEDLERITGKSQLDTTESNIFDTEMGAS